MGILFEFNHFFTRCRYQTTKGLSKWQRIKYVESTQGHESRVIIGKVNIDNINLPVIFHYNGDLEKVLISN